MADVNDPDRKEFDWDLPINVPTIGVHRTLRVTSNESIGAVMIKLASKLGKPSWLFRGSCMLLWKVRRLPAAWIV